MPAGVAARVPLIAGACLLAFCAGCGGAAPRLSPERGFAVVPAGALDTDPGIRPAAHIFVGSKASWFRITGDVPQFDELPPQA